MPERALPPAPPVTARVIRDLRRLRERADGLMLHIVDDPRTEEQVVDLVRWNTAESGFGAAMVGFELELLELAAEALAARKAKARNAKRRAARMSADRRAGE